MADPEIIVDVWLYGNLALYAHPGGGSVYANVSMQLSQGSTVQDLLDQLKMPTEARGITFINGDLSAMPGLQPDLIHTLKDGDRIAFFHLRSMWPFQYRQDTAMVKEMSEAVKESDGGVHHDLRSK